MSSGTFQAQAGYVGKLLFLGNDLNCERWHYEDWMNVTAAPRFNQDGPARGTLSSVGYVDRAPGLVEGFLRASGTWNALFNPFAASMQVGAYGLVIARINNVVAGGSTQAILQHWVVENISETVCSFEATWVFDGVFTDFSAGDA